MERKNNELIIIPKIEKYIEYMLTILIKLPRTEKSIKPYFVPQFIATSYAGIENRGMHKASKDIQKAMRIAKRNWSEYYILKMDVAKYFQNIDKRILCEILKRKIRDRKLLWLTRTILLSTEGMKGLP